ncbi:MAG: hypothetical protein KBD76_06060 [Bacteriovorax sp.]|nr:hypothetical protein [Bacteriovorax sp.]
MSQVFHSKKNHTQHCIHTKHVFSLLDIPKTEESFKRLSKHVESCTICTEELRKIQLKALGTKVFIPKAVMGRDLRQSFEREVGELFNVMNLNDRHLLRQNMKKGFRFVDSMGVDFLKSLTSPMMIKAYFFATALFIALKYYL